MTLRGGVEHAQPNEQKTSSSLCVSLHSSLLSSWKRKRKRQKKRCKKTSKCRDKRIKNCRLALESFGHLHAKLVLYLAILSFSFK